MQRKESVLVPPSLIAVARRKGILPAMIEFSILGSGSGGNAMLVRAPHGRLLVDAGLSAAQITARLAAAGVEPESLDGILLTHEHGDHSSGLRVFTRKHRVPVLTSAMTREVLRENVADATSWRIIPESGAFTFAGFHIDAFSVPHDAVAPLGFVLRNGGAAIGIVSDLGHATTLVRARLREMNALFVEANYDAVLLEKDTKRPWSTRQRIASRHGHLSNSQTAALVAEVAGDQLQRIVLGHLSRDCNHPDLAAEAVATALGPRRIPISCALQDEPTPWFCVHPTGANTQARPAALLWEQPLLF